MIDFENLLLVEYCIYEIIISKPNKQRSMPSENTVSSARIDSELVEKMERRRNRLDSLFDLALVLLGILSAAEFQYYLTLSNEVETNVHLLYVVTGPFVFMIGAWLTKELFSDRFSSEVNMISTEFCWAFWSFTLHYYLLLLTSEFQFGGLQIGMFVPLVLSLLLVFSIRWAYSRTYPLEIGDVKMYKYFRSIKWTLAWWFMFALAYLLLTVVIIPWG